MPVAVPLEEVVALLLDCRCSFYCAYRDGMNLVAKEYIASRPQARRAYFKPNRWRRSELSDALLDDRRRSSVVAAL